MPVAEAKINNPIKKVRRPRHGWHRADIKAALEKLGLSLKAVGLDAGFGPRSGAKVLDTWWPNMERVVADALGVEPWDIWPDRYNDYGQPVQQGNPNKVKASNAGRPRNVNLQAVD